MGGVQGADSWCWCFPSIVSLEDAIRNVVMKGGMVDSGWWMEGSGGMGQKKGVTDLLVLDSRE